MLRNWAFLHPEMPWRVRMHDYFTCLDCGVVAEWRDPEVVCPKCKQVLIRGNPGACPICGLRECVEQADLKASRWNADRQSKETE